MGSLSQAIAFINSKNEIKQLSHVTIDSNLRKIRAEVRVDKKQKIRNN